MHDKKKVVAFEQKETYVFCSITDTALAYGINKKIVIDRINDGCTLKDGYTTLDWYSPEEETIEELKEIKKHIVPLYDSTQSFS